VELYSIYSCVDVELVLECDGHIDTITVDAMWCTLVAR